MKVQNVALLAPRKKIDMTLTVDFSKMEGFDTQKVFVGT